MEPFVGYILESNNTEEMMNMLYIAMPLTIVAVAIMMWLCYDGPQKIFAERRLAAEANARAAEANLRAEELKLERAKLEIG